MKKEFFDLKKVKTPFNADVLSSKIMKFIVKEDLPFSLVESLKFQEVINYLKPDFEIISRRTMMRRLENLYQERKDGLKDKLNSFNSKFSVTCDVWTSKNQLSFFGFTIHYIDDEWKYQETLLAFKFLEGEHDGESLAKAFIEVLEDYNIADRLLGVTV